jgi:hypothetical protein
VLSQASTQPSAAATSDHEAPLAGVTRATPPLRTSTATTAARLRHCVVSSSVWLPGRKGCSGREEQ